MTDREIVRTGLVLGGIWIVVTAAAPLAAGIVEFVQLSAEMIQTFRMLAGLWALGLRAA